MSRNRALLVRSTISRALGLATLVLVSTGCAAPAAQESSEAQSHAAATPTANPTPATSVPTASTPSSTPSPPLARGWQPIGQAEAVTVLVSFERGYVGALGGSSAALFSADGSAWEATTLFERRGCPETFDGSMIIDAWVTHGASSGNEVLLAGGTLSATPETCVTSNATPGGEVAWLTSDGHTWVQSELFGAPNTAVDALWSMADGWYATVSGFEQPPTTWQSPDGIHWHEVGSPAGVGAPSEPGPDGSRLWWARNERDEVVLLRSDDDATWQELTAPPALTAAYASATTLPPGPDGSAWLVVTQASEELTSWTSSDLDHWERRDFPEIQKLTDVTSTADGHVISGSLCPPYLIDGPCVESERQYVSSDGGEWVPIALPLLESIAIVDGPAGIIAVQWDGSAWRLEK